MLREGWLNLKSGRLGTVSSKGILIRNYTGIKSILFVNIIWDEDKGRFDGNFNILR